MFNIPEPEEESVPSAELLQFLEEELYPKLVKLTYPRDTALAFQFKSIELHEELERFLAPFKRELNEKGYDCALTWFPSIYEPYWKFWRL